MSGGGDRLNPRAGWRNRAACLQLDMPANERVGLFFALPKTPEAELAARVCAECPVAEPCAAAGRANRELGRWGEYVRLVEKYRMQGGWRRVEREVADFEKSIDECEREFEKVDR